MENYYSLLGITHDASTQDIKKAFRKQAKQLHPDLAGVAAEEAMRKLLSAYEVLSDRERRYEYDRAFRRFNNKVDFDYRTFLQERVEDPVCQAKLIFFDLLHLEEEDALTLWRIQGGLEFPLEKYLDREDWMDCTYILAEELEKRRCYYEAFVLLVNLVREERRLPYFRHFMSELEGFLKELVRLKLKPSVNGETYIACMEMLLNLGFSPKEEARWLRSQAETLAMLGDIPAAQGVFREALKRDPRLPSATRLRRKLNI
ncbi:MAG: J domain-containing protein [Treponema sp.]|jgi:tetratricopeptide (TPR) repeat protein|nr:J domain-containing protein [Treponema sp.]